MGTPNYMSPEQVRGEIADARSDLWSLGIVLYESLAGQRPFDGSSAADIVSNIIAREPAPLSALNRDVPVELARLVTGLLSKERDRRNSAAEVVQALKRLVESVAARPARSRRQKVVGAAVVLVASLLSASGWWASSLVITSIFVAPCASARPRRFSVWRSIMALAFIRNTRPNSRKRSPLHGRGCHGVEGHGGRNPPPHIRGSRCYASLTGASNFRRLHDRHELVDAGCVRVGPRGRDRPSPARARSWLTLARCSEVRGYQLTPVAPLLLAKSNQGIGHSGAPRGDEGSRRPDSKQRRSCGHKRDRVDRAYAIQE